ncbi:MAG TPA: phosphoribosyltransferase family protein [Devosia sp.]|nr:phosphoribosyltransferase family protein [Devosia sp.]
MTVHQVWRFQDRHQAGRELAVAIARLELVNPVVLALPRGGVPVASHVATAIGAPLDLLLVRKLGVPGQPELGMGAIADGNPASIYVNTALVHELGISQATIDREIARQMTELDRRRQSYGLDHYIDVRGRPVVLVDDGIATGGTVRVALQALRARAAARLIVAVPVAPRDALDALASFADQIICLCSPEHFMAVGQVYQNFEQTSDAEVIALLQQARRA